MKTEINIFKMPSGIHLVNYVDVAENGKRHVWRSYETEESVERIREYVSKTYPDLIADFNV
jgi:hypothetical protein